MDQKITFGVCLNELLIARGWSAARLSREISTDASYVRRWIRGERVPSLKSEFIAQIAYSLSHGIDSRGSDKVRKDILRTLTELGFSADVNKSLRELLTECLTSSQIYSLKLNSEDRKIRSNRHDDDIMNILKHSKTTFEKTLLSSAATHERSKLSVPFGFLQGRQAIIKAVIGLLHEAAHLEKPEEILLTFQGDYDIPEKSDLNKEWNQVFISVLQKGWNIRHLMRLNKNVNRSFRIVSKIFHWIGYTGKYEPMYFSKYGTASPAFELMIVKNVGALICFNAGESDYVDTALYIHQKEAMEALTGYFNKLAANTQPILDLLSIEEYFYQTTVKDKTPNNHYLCFHDLHMLTYPYQIWCRYLQRTIADPLVIAQHASRIKSRLESFYEQIERYKYRIICPTKAVEYLVKCNRYYIQGKYQEPTKEDIIEHIRHLIHLLETYHNLELALLEDNQKDLLSPRNWEVKGEHSVFMSLYGVTDAEYEENKMYISISEGTIASTFQDYYNELWDRITPRCKDKAQVIAWLKQQMTVLLRNHG